VGEGVGWLAEHDDPKRLITQSRAREPCCARHRAHRAVRRRAGGGGGCLDSRAANGVRWSALEAILPELMRPALDPGRSWALVSDRWGAVRSS